MTTENKEKAHQLWFKDRYLCLWSAVTIGFVMINDTQLIPYISHIVFIKTIKMKMVVM